MRTPNEADRKKCIALRETSKRGGYIHKDDMAFLNRMLKKYPWWYSSTEHEIFNATVPFGSNVRMEPKKLTDAATHDGQI